MIEVDPDTLTQVLVLMSIVVVIGPVDVEVLPVAGRLLLNGAKQRPASGAATRASQITRSAHPKGNEG